MGVDDIPIRTDADLGRPYRELGPVKARVTSKTVFSKDRTEDEVNAKLSGVAAKMGADAVVNVRYERGMSFTSWKALTASGTAVVIDDEAQPA